MISESQTRYGSRVACQGRWLRPCWACHCTKVGAITGGITGAVRGGVKAKASINTAPPQNPRVWAAQSKKRCSVAARDGLVLEGLHCTGGPFQHRQVQQ